jgi:hypothetical protein
MDFHKEIKEQFVTEWNRLCKEYRFHTPRALTDNDLDAINDSFTLNDVYEELEAVSYEKQKRHLLVLRGLTRNYARLLFHESDGGLQITKRSISMAKSRLKENRDCPIYPCG